MVKKMNKSEFATKLSGVTNYSFETSFKIVEILENNFFISKNSKDKIIREIKESIKIDEEKATDIYEEAVKIFKDEVKYRLKHPFKSKD